MTTHTTPGRNEVDTIRRVTWVGFWVNAILMVLKIAIGFYGHSDALVADGVHSLSDFATDLIVLLFVSIAYKSADSGHPYGHGKFETFAALIIGVILLGVAIGIGNSGLRSVIASAHGEMPPRPDLWTLAVAVISILAKELLFRYTIRASRTVGSQSLRANAYHHRSDAVSSIATLAGISAAYFLGDSWRILDPIASMLIAVFIAVSAIQICLPAINELLEKSLSPSRIDKVESIIEGVAGVKAFHRLRTRRNGHSVIIDVHIKVDPDITVSAGHDIASAVEKALHEEFDNDIITNIHVEPFRPSH
ncbi:MAG: cation diffusion facilitator family transporter [Duncaniella sp.]|nr:cation diffusion facilitator family transporter [Duncaniella sp.]MDE5751438.1 cation diffusion facilitator family transporter [Duncaniella sp.]MDE6170248.1 cation diffusion facilitator family transporter [Duncaniella sp.]